MRDLKFLGKNELGIEVRDYKTFPSSEWGEDGGLQCEMYDNGKHIGRLFNAGDGGMASFYKDKECSDQEYEAFMKKVYKCALPYLQEYPNSLKARKGKATEDDILLVVGDIEEEYFRNAKRVKSNEGR